MSEHLRRLSWPAWLCTAEGPAIYPQRIGGSAVVALGALVEVCLDIATKHRVTLLPHQCSVGVEVGILDAAPGRGTYVQLDTWVL